jgi:hypothetical protein
MAGACNGTRRSGTLRVGLGKVCNAAVMYGNGKRRHSEAQPCSGYAFYSLAMLTTNRVFRITSSSRSAALRRCTALRGSSVVKLGLGYARHHNGTHVTGEAGQIDAQVQRSFARAQVCVTGRDGARAAHRNALPNIGAQGYRMVSLRTALRRKGIAQHAKAGASFGVAWPGAARAWCWAAKHVAGTGQRFAGQPWPSNALRSPATALYGTAPPSGAPPGRCNAERDPAWALHGQTPRSQGAAQPILAVRGVVLVNYPTPRDGISAAEGVS